MDQNGPGFLERVRALDEPVKRKVLVFSSIIAMVLVVAVWLMYFNDIVMAPIQNADQTMASSTAAASLSASGTVPSSDSSSSSGQGFWHSVESSISGFSQVFTGGHEYIQSSN